MITLSHSFAAANTVRGFVSMFPQRFHPDRFRRLFLIKGGPGCGKSTFLRACAEAAAQAGCVIEKVHCSADPSSLDGLILPDQKIGLVDATAPHTKDPIYPGAVDTVLNFCSFFDCDALSAKTHIFREFHDKKTACYEAAYSYLSAVGVLQQRRDAILTRIYDIGKARDVVKRQLRAFPRTNTDRKEAWIRAFCADGFVTLEQTAFGDGRTFTVGDAFGSAHMFFSCVERECRICGLDCLLLRDPLRPDAYEGACICNSLFLLCGENDGLHPFINEKRFLVRQNMYPGDSAELRALLKLEHELLQKASEQFSCARQLHLDCEALYAPHIDFSEKEAFTENFIDNVFLPLLKCEKSTVES